MAFPPDFLDEIRARAGLASVIQRRTRLVKKGREWSGLCPFHNEKSPSFYVNEDKGFFHCFGCGAHGDVIGFVMRAENRSFVEAVETLAAEAGLEVPKPTPEARERAVKQATLYEVMEEAASWFQAQLKSPAGAAARSYLERRGLDVAVYEKFRLGYAPNGQGLLKQHLLTEFPEPLLAEAGLIGQREGSSGTFDYFRDRVMFPIFDRRGRVIAFGGRVLGDAKPKYLNSPDTPVFHKGTNLYGLHWAREGVGRGADLVVTEGYMDVIALHEAGFNGAVAPLGTALTADQLEEIWKLAAEPILCFDGDAAGQRAAARALERALPTIKAGRSFRFASLPAGEDPDTLIRRQGVASMADVLRRAQPLAEFLWGLELTAKPIDTPERKADLSARLNGRAAFIADETVKREYQSFFRNCLYERLRPRRSVRGKPGKFKITLPDPPLQNPLMRRLQEVLLVTVLRHPDLLHEIIEELAEVSFKAVELDRLRQEILNVHGRESALDAAGLKYHLTNSGFAEELAALADEQVLLHASFALSDERDVVLAGWRAVAGRWAAFLSGKADIEAAVGRFKRDPEGALDLLLTLPNEAERLRLGVDEANSVESDRPFRRLRQ